MKCMLLGLALVVLIGVSSGSKLRGGPLARRLAEKMAKRIGGGGPGAGGDCGGAARLSAMLAFGSLVGKCEMAAREIEMLAEEWNVDVEEAWEYAMQNFTLYHACPYMETYAKCYIKADESTQDVMEGLMAPHGLLFQCCNLATDVELMEFEYGFTAEGEGPVESQLMTHGQGLGEACEHIFGTASEEADELEEDLHKAQGGDCGGDDKRSSNLRSLVRSLKQLMSSRRRR